MYTRTCGFIAACAVALALAPAALADVVEVPGDAGFIISGSRTASGFGIVRIRSDEDNNGTVYEHVVGDFFPYGISKVGEGVRVATGDFNGDGNDELIVSTSNSLPVKIFGLNADGSLGSLIEAKSVYGKRGAYVAAGDVNGDGRDELVVGAGIGKPGLVRIFSDTDLDGKVFDNQTDSFTAFTSGFTGGVTVTADNTNNLGGAEVVMGMASKGRLIRVRTDTDGDNKVSDHPILETFSVYPSSYKNGVNVAAGAIQSVGGGGAEIAVAPMAGKRKVVIKTDTDADGLVGDNPAAEQFYAFGSGWAGGVRLALGDTDHSSFFVEVVTAPGKSASKVKTKVRDDTGDVGAKLSDEPPTSQFKALPSSVKAGAWVAVAVVRTSTYSFPGFPQSIADTTTLNTEFWVPASAGKIRDLDVGLNIFHSFDGDLDVSLTHVNTATTVNLFNDVGGSNEGFVIRLNDEAGTDMSTATNPKLDGPIAGTFNPGGAALLSIFDGQDASGLWRLTIVDDTAGDTGTLFGWNLIVTN